MRIFVAIAIVILLLGGFIYFSGFYYFGRAWYRAKYENPAFATEAVSRLFAVDENSVAIDTNFVNGILSWFGKKSVGVWTRNGLKRFALDEYSVYFYRDLCSENSVENQPDIKGGFRGYIGSGEEVEQIRQRARVGDFVTLVLTKEGTGGIAGNAREVIVYNFWPFLQGDRRTLCKR
jgi:hypothetical protein